MKKEEFNNLEPNADWWDSMPEVLKKHINEGIKDVEEGRTMSSEEFWEGLRNG